MASVRYSISVAFSRLIQQVVQSVPPEVRTYKFLLSSMSRYFSTNYLHVALLGQSIKSSRGCSMCSVATSDTIEVNSLSSTIVMHSSDNFDFSGSRVL